MTIRPEIKFGLNVTRVFTDVADRDEAIENLGLKLDDLDVIRDSAAEYGITRTDVRALSQLDIPIQRYILKLSNDVVQYSGIVNESAGAKQQLRGNLTANGVLAASAVKYRYLEEGTNQLKNADISTSRVSSWSSTVSPPSDTSPIFYGGDLDVGGTITASKVNLTNNPLEVKFKDSEIPTHKIQATVNGSTVYFYAMKGIPLVFEGFFRNVNTIIELVNNGAVSVVIVNIEDDRFTVEFENIGGVSSTSANLVYRDNRAAPKNLEIYQDPRNIRTLQLNNLGISELPAAELPNLNELRLYRNLLREFPNFNQFSPQVTLLDIRENLFNQADDETIRSFNQAVVDRLPNTITTLLAGNTFTSSITGDLTKLSSLRYINLNSHTRGGSRPIFSADGNDPTGAMPVVANTVTDYRMNHNQFRTITDPVKQLPNLRRLEFVANDVTDPSFFIDSEDIEYVNVSQGNQINVPNMNGKQSLERYLCRRLFTGAYRGAGEINDVNAFTTTDGTYKFGNCPSLTEINFYYSYYRGPLPQFTGNTSLSRVDLYRTSIRGGKSDTEDDYVIYPDTFNDCAETLSFFRIGSTSLINKPIHPDAFLNLENITYLYVRSFNRGVSGELPAFTGMPRLNRLYFLQNNFTGALPTFSGNPRMYVIHLAYNKLSGSIPRLSLPSLGFLYLHYNNFDSFDGLDTDNLRRLFVQNNNITGAIPDLSNLRRLYDCYLNNNSFSSYTPGSLAPLTRLRRVDVSNNPGLTEGDINAFVGDLYDNYETNPRGGVAINLRNTAAPTGDSVDKLDFLRNNGWTIRG